MRVPVNTGLAQLSDSFMLAALVLYSLAVLAFAADLAYGRQAGTVAQPPVRVRELATATAPGARAPAGSDARSAPPTRERLAARTGLWVRAGLALSLTGALAHVLGVIARGAAAHRVPWGDMYEFVTALTCVAVLFFLAVMLRYRAWSLGLFVMGAVVAALGVAETVIYTPAGPLAPALQSYWLAIHVTAMTLATGIFLVVAVLGVVYLCSERTARRVASGRLAAPGGIMRMLPGPEALDRLAYRTVVFAFPVWTFGIMAGAIWADQAWGRYWGWDPVETWAFITWVVYACFLHARATAGWRGRRAAVIQLAGFGCLVFNVVGVQLLLTGLHSYAGLG